MKFDDEKGGVVKFEGKGFRVVRVTQIKQYS